MLSESELDGLLTACQKLPLSDVIEEEAHVFKAPLLILMSTVLSLCRDWYANALPARQRFEQGFYRRMSSGTLREFQAEATAIIGEQSDYRALSQTLWNTNERQKAQQLLEATSYFIEWHEKHVPDVTEFEALKTWSKSSSKQEILKIKGVGPRALEQILWYAEGTQAVKLDRHVVRFVNNAVGRSVSESDALSGLQNVAKQMGISATALDVRIWDYLQAGNG